MVKVWISGITNLRTNDGWLDFCAQCVFSLGVELVAGQRAELYLGEKNAALGKNSARTDFGQAVFRADYVAYPTSPQLHAVPVELDLLQSLGRTCVCWDNEMIEAICSMSKI